MEVLRDLVVVVGIPVSAAIEAKAKSWCVRRRISTDAQPDGELSRISVGTEPSLGILDKLVVPEVKVEPTRG
jgi:hypothetical protein